MSLGSVEMTRWPWELGQGLLESRWKSAILLVALSSLVRASCRRQRGRSRASGSGTWPGANEAQVRAFLGVGVCIGSLALPPWILLPVFIDNKIAADEALPGLTEDTLTVTTTAIFLGWLLGSLCLNRLMLAFSKAQLIVAGLLGLLLVTVATVTLPHLTKGNLVVFTAVRFVHGLLLNTVFVETLYVQEAVPAGWGNLALVCINVGFCLVDILQAYACGGPMMSWDWRLQAALLYSVPLILALWLAFPERWDILCSMLGNVKAGWRPGKHGSPFEDAATMSLSTTELRHGMALATGFLACGCSFHGLSYSAGQLSPNRYKSMMLFSAVDSLGYLSALSASSFGRSRVQAGSFFLATVCLFLCSTGEPGTPLVMCSAMIGRMCLDLCFTTVYVFVEIFSPSAQKRLLPACEFAMRLGGTLAPYSGTLPPSTSCKIFGFLCLAAGLTSVQLPDRPYGSPKTQLVKVKE